MTKVVEPKLAPWWDGSVGKTQTISNTTPSTKPDAEKDRPPLANDIEIVRNPSPKLYKEIIPKLVADEGWDNSLHCYEIWLRSVGQENFSLWCAIDKRFNRIVGTMSRCTYLPKKPGDIHFTQFSMLYLQPEYRGLGLGRKLYDPAYEETRDTNIFCYGVEAMWRKYAKDYGFDKYPHWQLIALKANCSDARLDKLGDPDPSVELRDWRRVSLDDIFLYNRRLTDGVNRESYIVQALNHPESVTLVAVSGSSNTVVGMCQVRELVLKRIGISLFYADSEKIAKTLLRATIERFVDSQCKKITDFTQLVYKTPSVNENSLKLFSSLVDEKITHREALVTQFTHKILNWPVGLIYSIADEHSGLV
ncbi:hypothetical protein DdX_00285 [Ditylenchus destructor]|uniref:N-acetyltransferase domain-containing protein n=1 Tax=Ditylenchus destructor TaxID=166010 RepID=A0AAD4NIF5_9BILA|nr:hypothetical protein DdX_00285 [Ditylenchus destructor]